MRPERALGAVLGVLAVLLAVALAWAGAAGERHPGLTAVVRARLVESGVENPVTAVLLNFRGLDTLLEVSVLVLALVCVLSLAPEDAARDVPPPVSHGREPSPMLGYFVARLVPLTVLLAAALWWKGSSFPGGAFQAGTLLAAAGVLMLLSGLMRTPSVGPAVRVLALLGPVGFLGIGLVMALTNEWFLDYPSQGTKALTLAAEMIFTLSIAANLLMLVVGIPAHRPRSLSGAEP